MSEEDIRVIRVPASTANLGPGFDSIGLALKLYLTIQVEKSTHWEVVFLSKELKDAQFPIDETNFICQVAIRTATLYKKELSPCRLLVQSDIPLTRGLGSSAAAIVAGIELADSLCDLKLTKHDKLKIASNLEGHPDNVGAALFGGLVVGSQVDDEVHISAFHKLGFETVAVIPNTELLTKSSRMVLPEQLPFSYSVKASAVSNQLIASLLSRNWEQAGKMMEKDLFHQPYRRKLVPHLTSVEEYARKKGAFGVALSGAGPTVICFIENGKEISLSRALAENYGEMQVMAIKVDHIGSTVKVNPSNICSV